MRKALGAMLLLSAAACGSNENADRRSENLATFDVQEAPAADASAPDAPGAPPRPPEVSPTAAPGVAFDYRYSFRLPPTRIGAVQEQHAAACEKLGPDRCRITGMTYQQDGKDNVSAQLALKLDPALARRFGRDASDLVARAEGLVTSVQISGEDVGSRIEAEQRNQSEVGESLAQVEAQLAQKGRSSRERAELQRQAEELRGSVRASDRAIGEQRRTLATTPMVFNYAAGATDQSFSGDLARAFQGFLDSGRVLIVALIYLLPWLLLALAGLLGWKWVNRRFLGGGRAPAHEAPLSAPAA